jgi:hypothetical protein
VTSRRAAGLLVAGALLLSGCSEVEASDAGGGYEPSKVEEVDGSDVKQVSFTTIGADRVGLATAPIHRSGRFSVVPYAALIYDGQGDPWVYTVTGSLTFLRQPVLIDRIEGDRVLLSDAPRPGTRVVTVGAAEVFGTELDIAGH